MVEMRCSGLAQLGFRRRYGNLVQGPFRNTRTFKVALRGLPLVLVF